MKRYFWIFFSIFNFAFWNLNYASATDVSGIISTDTTWTVADSPYIVTGNILVDVGVTLTIQPGVTVKFFADTYLMVDGVLKVQGTGSNRIIFTSNKDTPSRHDWEYIKFRDSSVDADCIIKYAEIKYARYGIYCDNASPTISNNIILNNSDYGIFCYHGSFPSISNNTVSDNSAGIYCDYGSPSISNNTISNNNYGIFCYESHPSISGNIITGNNIGVWNGYLDNPTITNNDLYENTNYNVENEGSKDITAINNWWGMTDTDEIETKIYDFYDDFEKGKIIYQPFATEPFFVPSKITDLVASLGPGEGEVNLCWSAPGNDGTAGTASYYSIRYLATEITESNWESASVWKDKRPVSGPYGIAETETVTGLVAATTYYFSIKTVNSTGIWSDLSNIAVVFTKDLTPPVAPSEVCDGTGEDIDFTCSSTTLSANWTAASDREAGIKKYWYAIGNGPGKTDVVGWKDNGTSRTATETGLSLEHGEKYYFLVKAENGVGLLSEVKSSDGVLVDLTPPSGKPATPQDRGEYGGETIKFTWTEGTVSDPESGIVGYNLQVKNEKVSVIVFDKNVGDVLEYSVPNCEDGKTYYARVRAKNGAGLDGDWSEFSDGIICDTVPPEKPIEVEIEQTEGSINFSAQAEAGTSIKTVVVKNQRGDILEISAVVSIDALGKISINLDSQEILGKYPLTTGIKIAIGVEDRAGNPSEIACSSLLRISPAEDGLICYNNVFNPDDNERANIIYKLVEPGEVWLEIFDARGNKLKIILDSYRTPGCYEETWDGTDRNNTSLGSGIYLVLFRTGRKKYIKKIAIVK